jgi:hypothetical protein
MKAHDAKSYDWNFKHITCGYLHNEAKGVEGITLQANRKHEASGRRVIDLLVNTATNTHKGVDEACLS